MDAGGTPDAGPRPAYPVQVSPAAKTLTGAGQTVVLVASLDLGGGTRPASADEVEWVTSNAAHFSLAVQPDGTAVARAETAVGSAVVVARSRVDPTRMSDPVLLMVAELEDGVVTVDDDALVFPRRAARLLVGQRDPLSLPEVMPNMQGDVMVGPFLATELAGLVEMEDAETGATIRINDILAVADGGIMDAGTEVDAGADDAAVDPGTEPVLSGGTRDDGGMFVPSQDPFPVLPAGLVEKRFPAVVHGPAPAVGTVLLGTGLQPLAGRVVSAEERSGYALLVMEHVAPDDVFKQADVSFSLDALRSAGMLSRPYEQAVTGGPNAVPSTPRGEFCKDKWNTTGADSDSRMTLTPRVVGDFSMRLGSGFLSAPRHLLARFGMVVTLDANMNMTLSAGVKHEFECTFPPWGLGFAAPVPLPGPLAGLLEVYVSAPRPYLEVKTDVRLVRWELGMRQQVVQNAIVGMEWDAVTGASNLSDFGTVVSPAEFTCKLNGLDCTARGLDATDFRATLETETGIKVEAGFGFSNSAALVLELLKFSLGLTDDLSLPRFPAVKGKVALVTGVETILPSTAAMRDLRGAGITSGIKAGVKPDLDWLEKVLKAIGIELSIPLFQFSGAGPTLEAPVSDTVEVASPHGHSTRVVTGSAPVARPVRVADGETLSFQVDLAQGPFRVPVQDVHPLLRWVLSDPVDTRMYVAPAGAERAGGASAFPVVFSAVEGHRVTGTWTVPTGFCAPGGVPTTAPVEFKLADTWGMFGVPLLSNTGGSLRMVCGQVKGRVDACTANRPMAAFTVKVAGDCGFQKDIVTGMDGTFSFSSSEVPSACTTLHAEATVDGTAFRTADVPFAAAAAEADLGSLVIRRGMTRVLGTTVDLVGDPLSGATVLWNGLSTTSGTNGSFTLGPAYSDCSVAVSGSLEDRSGSKTVNAVFGGDTQAGDIRLRVNMFTDKVYFARGTPGGTFPTAPWNLVVVDADGGNAQVVAALPGAAEWSLRVSPDGSHAAYTCDNPDFNSNDGDFVCVVRLRGTGGFLQLPRVPMAGFNTLDELPTWTFDNRLYVNRYYWARPPLVELSYLVEINPDTGAEVSRVAVPLNNLSASPAPNAQWFAQPEFSSGSYWMRTHAMAGGALISELALPEGCMTQDPPAWHPDGSTMVFTGSNTYGGAGYQVCAVDVDASGGLSNVRRVDEALAGTYRQNVFHAGFSTDGSRITWERRNQVIPTAWPPGEIMMKVWGETAETVVLVSNEAASPGFAAAP